MTCHTMQLCQLIGSVSPVPCLSGCSSSCPFRCVFTAILGAYTANRLTCLIQVIPGPQEDRPHLLIIMLMWLYLVNANVARFSSSNNYFYCFGTKRSHSGQPTNLISECVIEVVARESVYSICYFSVRPHKIHNHT